MYNFVFIIIDPNLEPDQFKQMMNLIHIEGQIEGINQIIKKFKNTDNPQKHELVMVGIN